MRWFSFRPSGAEASVFGPYPALRCAPRWAKFGRSLWERVRGLIEVRGIPGLRIKRHPAPGWWTI